jgi:hypothetical protein
MPHAGNFEVVRALGRVKYESPAAGRARYVALFHCIASAKRTNLDGMRRRTIPISLRWRVRVANFVFAAAAHYL